MAYQDYGDTIFDTARGAWIPKDLRNHDYRKIVDSGDPVVPAPTKQPVREDNKTLRTEIASASSVADIKAAILKWLGT